MARRVNKRAQRNWIILEKLTCSHIQKSGEADAHPTQEKTLRFPPLDSLVSLVYLLSLGTITQIPRISGVKGTLR